MLWLVDARIAAELRVAVRSFSISAADCLIALCSFAVDPSLRLVSGLSSCWATSLQKGMQACACLPSILISHLVYACM